jgi:nuclease S1
VTISLRRMAAISVVIINPLSAWGWSAEAHQAIALIAINQLRGTNTAVRIAGLLNGLTLDQIATCPDQVRGQEEHGTALDANCKKIFPRKMIMTGPWHFVDTPVGTSPTATAADINSVCNNNCVVVKITSFLAVLQAATPGDSKAKKASEAQALSFVVHFMGDITQPLHASERNNDGGGNAEHIAFFNVSGLTLHGIWDNQIVAGIAPSPSEFVTAVQPGIATAESEPAGMPVDWAIESFHYAATVAYPGIPAPNGNTDVANLGADYQSAADPVVRIQVARAGVRLAAALRAALP